MSTSRNVDSLFTMYGVEGKIIHNHVEALLQRIKHTLVRAQAQSIHQTYTCIWFVSEKRWQYSNYLQLSVCILKNVTRLYYWIDISRVVITCVSCMEKWHFGICTRNLHDKKMQWFWKPCTASMDNVTWGCETFQIPPAHWWRNGIWEHQLPRKGKRQEIQNSSEEVGDPICSFAVMTVRWSAGILAGPCAWWEPGILLWMFGIKSSITHQQETFHNTDIPSHPHGESCGNDGI